MPLPAAKPYNDYYARTCANTDTFLYVVADRPCCYTQTMCKASPTLSATFDIHTNTFGSSICDQAESIVSPVGPDNTI